MSSPRLLRPDVGRPNARVNALRSHAHPVVASASLAGYNIITSNDQIPADAAAPTYYPIRLTLTFTGGDVRMGPGGMSASAFTVAYKNVGTLVFNRLRFGNGTAILEDCTTTIGAAGSPASSLISYNGNSNALVDGGGVPLASFSNLAITASGPTYPLYVSINRSALTFEVRYMRDFKAAQALGSNDGTWDIYAAASQDWINGSGIFGGESMANSRIVEGLNMTGTNLPPHPHSSWIGIDGLYDENNNVMGDFVFFPATLIS